MDAAMKTAMESMTHDPEVYARHHEGLVRWMERVLRAAGINQAYVKLSAQEAHVPPLYRSSTAILMVMLDPAVPRRDSVQHQLQSCCCHPVCGLKDDLEDSRPLLERQVQGEHLQVDPEGHLREGRPLGCYCSNGSCTQPGERKRPPPAALHWFLPVRRGQPHGGLRDRELSSSPGARCERLTHPRPRSRSQGMVNHLRQGQ